ncbi:MAG: bifunctional glutamate N-acetyltransferase/amino-acid acetyltransferase ArgJ [Bdellovibrionales bacterium]|nr:bifunctional glutamate N-acetyltransferase/amino-acid acetyltransferase ArgJ [Bdellovibrionales bacterium]
MTLGAGIIKTLLPKCFFASGLNCGVRKYRPDVGLLVSDVPAVAVAVYTQNTCAGEHIQYCKSLLPSEGIQALITNSGQANTAVGPVGAQDNLAMAQAVANGLNIGVDQVLTASTGVIGQRIDIEKVVNVVPHLIEAQSTTADTFATAIMTTDLVPKSATTVVQLSGGDVRITGVAKGSGMIHPNMATMLGYLLTDLKVETSVAKTMLSDVTNTSFNMISVDGEPSTNDTVFMLANGKSGVGLQNDEDYQVFLQALRDVATVLAKSIARDGEGATKLIEVRLKGAPTQELADKWARSLTVSPLIKTAIHGRDPNWGRIVGRLGGEQVPAEAFKKLDLAVQELHLINQGQIQNLDLEKLRNALKQDEILIEVDLKLGQAGTVAWGCDLSSKYVQINAEYTS